MRKGPVDWKGKGTRNPYEAKAREQRRGTRESEPDSFPPRSRSLLVRCAGALSPFALFRMAIGGRRAISVGPWVRVRWPGWWESEMNGMGCDGMEMGSKGGEGGLSGRAVKPSIPGNGETRHWDLCSTRASASAGPSPGKVPELAVPWMRR